jgi:hypothetical protein
MLYIEAFRFKNNISVQVRMSSLAPGAAMLPVARIFFMLQKRFIQGPTRRINEKIGRR